MTSDSRPFSLRSCAPLAVLLVLAAVHTSGSAAAGAAPADATPKTSLTKKKTQKTGGKLTVIPSSAETRKERERRLLRECRGAVNAGACEGYTR